MRFRNAALALSAALVAAALPAASAHAATRTVAESATLAPDSMVAATAGCPFGKFLAGGGFGLVPRYNPVDDTGAQPLVQQASPIDHRRWRSGAFSTFGGTDSTFFSVGRCDDRKSTRERNGAPITAATELTVGVKCPTKRHVVGGGYRITPHYDTNTDTGANVSVHMSKRRNQQVWEVGFTRDFGEDATVIAHAFCQRDIGPNVRSASDSVAAEDVGRYTAVADCPNFAEVLSGGFKAEPVGTPGSAMSTGLFPWMSLNGPLPQEDGWAATVSNDVGPLPGAELTAYAYCK